MDNRYLCRGKRADNGEWVYGFFATDYPNTERTMIICPDKSGEHGGLYYNTVNPTTVGHCTGLSAAKSYRGEELGDLMIFEGDIIRYTSHGKIGIGVLTWMSIGIAAWLIKSDNSYILLTDDIELEIIGTIFDQPVEYADLAGYLTW